MSSKSKRGRGFVQSPNMPKGVPTEDRLKITESQYLRFRITKLNEDLITLREQKLASDERIIQLSKVNLELQKKMILMETAKTYEEIGIQAGDQVMGDSSKDEFMIVRRTPGPAGTLPGAPSRMSPGAPPGPRPMPHIPPIPSMPPPEMPEELEEPGEPEGLKETEGPSISSQAELPEDSGEEEKTEG